MHQQYFELDQTSIYESITKHHCQLLIWVLFSRKRTQRQRHEAAQKFIDGTYTILVATDCAARGLNFGEVAHVINYDMPRKEQFVQYMYSFQCLIAILWIYIGKFSHRIGRTGRVGNIGRSTTFFDHHNVEEDQTHVINLVKVCTSFQNKNDALHYMVFRPWKSRASISHNFWMIYTQIKNR